MIDRDRRAGQAALKRIACLAGIMKQANQTRPHARTNRSGKLGGARGNSFEVVDKSLTVLEAPICIGVRIISLHVRRPSHRKRSRKPPFLSPSRHVYTITRKDWGRPANGPLATGGLGAATDRGSKGPTTSEGLPWLPARSRLAPRQAHRAAFARGRRAHRRVRHRRPDSGAPGVRPAINARPGASTRLGAAGPPQAEPSRTRLPPRTW